MSNLETIAALYGRLLGGLMAAAAILLGVMVAAVGIDVLLRNLFQSGIRGILEYTEFGLYLLTLLTAPWLLHRGQHIRVELLLVVLPRRTAWAVELAGDAVGLGASVALAWYGFAVTLASFSAGALLIKSVVFPEWWLMAPLPLAFTLIAVEFVFRILRLAAAERAPRTEATSVA